MRGWKGRVHPDDLYEVDSCVEFRSVGAFNVCQTRTGGTSALRPVNGDHVIPKTIIADYMAIGASTRYPKTFSQSASSSDTTEPSIDGPRV